MNTPFPVRADGTWFEWRRPVRRSDRVLLLDRDGVIIADRGYLSDPAGVELLDGIVPIMTAAKTAGIPCAVVTNQSGIARGYFDWVQFARVQDRMHALLAEYDVGADLVLACPHHPIGRAPYQHDDPPMRKPNPGMLRAALDAFEAEAELALMIGDKIDDMTAAAGAGLARGILVGHGSQTDHAPRRQPRLRVQPVKALADAVPFVMAWITETAEGFAGSA